MGLRTGIIGAGIVSQNNHLPSVRRNPRTELVCVADPDEETLRDATHGYSVRRYRDGEELLTQERLDWIHIATPVQTHYELARAAVEADVPVLVQKPATTTVAELAELQRLADERDVPLSVVHNWLYYPVIRDVRRRIEAGELGDIRAVETTFAGEGTPDETYRGNWVLDLAGGDFEEGLPHPFYLTLAFTGYPADESAIEVTARSIGSYENATYDGTTIQYTTDDGTIGSVTVLAESARTSEIRIYGEDGSLRVDIPSMTIERFETDAGPYHFFEERLRRNAALLRSAVTGLTANLRREGLSRIEERLDWHTETSTDGHYYLINEAAKALATDRQPPVTPEHSRWTLTLVEQVREAAESGEATGRGS